jgi:hypothetical protein
MGMNADPGNGHDGQAEPADEWVPVTRRRRSRGYPARGVPTAEMSAPSWGGQPGAASDASEASGRPTPASPADSARRSADMGDGDRPSATPSPEEAP